jgi:hypothetical protein
VMYVERGDVGPGAATKILMLDMHSGAGGDKHAWGACGAAPECWFSYLRK